MQSTAKNRFVYPSIHIPTCSFPAIPFKFKNNNILNIHNREILPALTDSTLDLIQTITFSSIIVSVCPPFPVSNTFYSNFKHNHHSQSRDSRLWHVSQPVRTRQFKHVFAEKRWLIVSVHRKKSYEQTLRNENKKKHSVIVDLAHA